MSRIVLVHWHEQEAEERAERLVAAGHEVLVHWRQDEGGKSDALRSLTDAPPDAVVIDLQRLPSHGNAIATWIRSRKITRSLPLVFVPGDEAKTEVVRTRFPDATFATWSRLPAALKRAIATPPKTPVVPKGADYSGTPLWKKLGIKAGAAVVAVRAPADFERSLGELPAAVEVRSRLQGEADVVVLFCRAIAEVQRDFPRAVEGLREHGGLWVAWPKKSSGVQTELSDDVVRGIGLDHGLVDNKVCAIDAVWSGQRFARRQQKKTSRG